MARSPLLSPDSRRLGRSTEWIEDDRAPITPALVHYGRPERKALLDPLDVAAVTLSVACLIVSICVINPYLGLAWKLGFESQIIVIGFLLSIMSLCLRRILPTLFMILEARWGPSSLQDYEAILRQSITLDHTHPLWRVVLFVMIALPLGLSVAYKRFLGGTSSAAITPQYAGHYGAAPLTAGNSSAERNPLFYALNATAPFAIAAANETNPPSDGLPTPYGFNTLLLKNSPDQVSAALLDIPMPDYIQSIQQNLSATQVWHLTANVNGTVTSLNQSLEHLRDDDGFWNVTFARAWAPGLESWNTYDSFRLGVIAGISRDFVPYVLAGSYHSPHDGDYDIGSYDVGDEDSMTFRSHSWLFNTVRQNCKGEWDITKSSVRLTNGSCSGVSLNQTLFQNSTLFWLDVMPVLVHALSDYDPNGIRNSSTWRLPAYAVNIAAAQWSRMIWMNHSFDTTLHEAYYPASEETIISTVATLDTGWLLYVVLAIQPLVTVLGFAAVCFFYHVPIGKGFGLVSILAGMDRESPTLLQGAALSGTLTRPVQLNIDVAHESDPKEQTGEIRYSLSIHGKQNPGVLDRGVYR